MNLRKSFEREQNNKFRTEQKFKNKRYFLRELENLSKTKKKWESRPSVWNLVKEKFILFFSNRYLAGRLTFFLWILFTIFQTIIYFYLTYFYQKGELILEISPEAAVYWRLIEGYPACLWLIPFLFWISPYLPYWLKFLVGFFTVLTGKLSWWVIKVAAQLWDWRQNVSCRVDDLILVTTDLRIRIRLTREQSLETVKYWQKQVAENLNFGFENLSEKQKNLLDLITQKYSSLVQEKGTFGLQSKFISETEVILNPKTIGSDSTYTFFSDHFPACLSNFGRSVWPYVQPAIDPSNPYTKIVLTICGTACLIGFATLVGGKLIQFLGVQDLAENIKNNNNQIQTLEGNISFLQKGLSALGNQVAVNQDSAQTGIELLRQQTGPLLLQVKALAIQLEFLPSLLSQMDNLQTQINVADLPNLAKKIVENDIFTGQQNDEVQKVHAKIVQLNNDLQELYTFIYDKFSRRFLPTRK